MLLLLLSKNEFTVLLFVEFIDKSMIYGFKKNTPFFINIVHIYGSWALLGLNLGKCIFIYTWFDQNNRLFSFTFSLLENYLQI